VSARFALRLSPTADRACGAYLGVHRETLRLWVRQAEADGGQRGDRPTTGERERLKALERENRDLRKANEILKSASVGR